MIIRLLRDGYGIGEWDGCAPVEDPGLAQERDLWKRVRKTLADKPHELFILSHVLSMAITAIVQSLADWIAPHPEAGQAVAPSATFAARRAVMQQFLDDHQLGTRDQAIQAALEKAGAESFVRDFERASFRRLKEQVARLWLVLQALRALTGKTPDDARTGTTGRKHAQGWGRQIQDAELAATWPAADRPVLLKCIPAMARSFHVKNRWLRRWNAARTPYALIDVLVVLAVPSEDAIVATPAEALKFLREPTRQEVASQLVHFESAQASPEANAAQWTGQFDKGLNYFQRKGLQHADAEDRTQDANYEFLKRYGLDKRMIPRGRKVTDPMGPPLRRIRSCVRLNDGRGPKPNAIAPQEESVAAINALFSQVTSCDFSWPGGSECKARLLLAWHELPENARDAWIKKYLDCKPSKEIGMGLGLGQNTIDVMNHRTCRVLESAILGPPADEDEMLIRVRKLLSGSEPATLLVFILATFTKREVNVIARRVGRKVTRVRDILRQFKKDLLDVLSVPRSLQNDAGARLSVAFAAEAKAPLFAFLLHGLRNRKPDAVARRLGLTPCQIRRAVDAVARRLYEALRGPHPA